jgi:hypothetical protein
VLTEHAELCGATSQFRSFVHIWPEGTNTNFLSSSSWAGYTARQDNAPVAATTTYDPYDEAGEFSDPPGELIAARAAYQLARGERRQIEERFRHLRTPDNEALLAIQSAHQAFKEAAGRYEAALIAFLAFDSEARPY